MTVRQLEQRVATLEDKVARLASKVGNGARAKDWRRTIGMFGDDPIMKQIFDEAAKFRERDRARARRQPAGKKRRK
jgi:hypothetical protein